MNSTRPLIFLHYLVRANNADAGRPWNSTAWDVCRAVRVDCSLSFTVPLLACWGNLVLRRWSPRHQEDKMKMLNLISSETTIKATLTAKEAKWQRREVKREKSVFALVYISKKMIAEERIRYVTPGSHELPPPFRSLREVHKGFRKSITNWLSKCGYNASRHSFAWKRKLFFASSPPVLSKEPLREAAEPQTSTWKEWDQGRGLKLCPGNLNAGVRDTHQVAKRLLCLKLSVGGPD